MCRLQFLLDCDNYVFQYGVDDSTRKFALENARAEVSGEEGRAIDRLRQIHIVLTTIGIPMSVADDPVTAIMFMPTLIFLFGGWIHQALHFHSASGRADATAVNIAKAVALVLVQCILGMIVSGNTMPGFGIIPQVIGAIG